MVFKRLVQRESPVLRAVPCSFRHRVVLGALALVCAGLMLGSSLTLAGCASSADDDVSEASQDTVSDEGSSTGVHISDELNTTTLFVFDTVVTINAYCDDEMLDELADRCEFFEDTLSRTVEGSDVWNINHAAGAPTDVNEETAYIIERALDIAEDTDGLFDITIGSISELWDFVEGVKPSDEAIQAALPHVDWRLVDVDGMTVTLEDPEAKIDLGGIAKGYIAEDLKQMLADAGVESATINLGGDVTVLGTKPDGQLWNVGIQDPNGSSNDVIASIRTEESVITSGLYEREFTDEDGVQYYHILDPKTGYPVVTDLESASIATESSIDGDAYATTMFLLGKDAALEFLNSDDRFEGLLIDKDGEISASSGSEFVLL